MLTTIAVLTILFLLLVLACTIGSADDKKGQGAVSSVLSVLIALLVAGQIAVAVIANS